MKQLLFVFIGGGFGSVLRYIIGKYLNNPANGIPYGTFTVNILGSLLIGIILGLAAKNNTLNQDQTLLLATGFCGGFTTFSAFAYENQALFKNGDFTSFAVYTISSFVVAFLAVFAGLYVSRILA
ncbi:fluoride efflux transporter CrcB [Flavobacteriaceae bacterium]|jgi:CrcB protein|nr:fluoride efflux transporter CrcB [Flavobacteriaceae bacterium]MDB4236684.1 fluoride efflux transporter CrcB [Flavobacteriaceae bacterium]MDB9780943.1 fluoride efflux transporter CrcB [Flavobacteriaceae bacterium]MDB9798820.1 fluoride efflux transporter CrcB [Flavobacteriaceae bacterium]MDB9927880.1 fluoride efflux transporter CrcB [Flavobacteriaceae bacterium]|tara:strand:- start:1966 stop:2340 length:375 start_codon:yes stop_codon:yes gene_type:complete